MRNIIYISSFDPINNLNINDIKEFNDSNTKFFLVLPYSKFSCLKDREAMIKLALKDLNINYEIDSIFNEKYGFSIDLVKLFEDYESSGKDNLYLLIHDEKPLLLSKEKIIKFKMKFYLKDKGSNLSSDIRDLKNLSTCEPVIDYIIRNNLYFMKIIEQYINGHRLNHSISVAKTAYKIAISNKLIRPDEYYIAGLLHDIGKHINEIDSLNYMEKYYRNYIDMPSWSYHQFIGAFLAKQLFPKISEGVYNAILTHCTGNKNMSSIQKVIYASDKIEPTRGYDSSMMIKHCEENYSDGFIEVLKENIKFLNKNSGDPSNNKLTKCCLECYLNDELMEDNKNE